MLNSYWLIEEAGVQTPAWNMQIDHKRLQEVSITSKPTLRFYEWHYPSATYGYFIDPNEFFLWEGVQKNQLQLARRATGGGIIFHTTDLAFSLIVPASHPFYTQNPLHSYQMIHALIANALNLELSDCFEKGGASFCMAKPTIYDLLYQGKKVGGAAQRRTKGGLLHQGSLHLRFPNPELILETIKEGAKLLDDMLKASYCLAEEMEDLQQVRNKIKQAMVRAICSRF